MHLLLLFFSYLLFFLFFFFKQKTAYEMRISDWSSDVCSSDLMLRSQLRYIALADTFLRGIVLPALDAEYIFKLHIRCDEAVQKRYSLGGMVILGFPQFAETRQKVGVHGLTAKQPVHRRSEEHTSELQSLMRTSYADFCLKKKKT